jgi:hypothetical protein
VQTPTEPDTVISARQTLGFDSSIPVEVWHIHRLDRLNADYDLVIFGEHNLAVGIAAVTTHNSVVTHSARLPGRQPQIAINPEQAIKLAQLSEEAETELVWQPSDISRSPLYPFWRVQEKTRSRYVDQGGNLWDSLSLLGRGG